jgi:hypothetical protein
MSKHEKKAVLVKEEQAPVTQDDVTAPPPEDEAAPLDEQAPVMQNPAIPQDAPVPPGNRLQPGQNDTRDSAGNG